FVDESKQSAARHRTQPRAKAMSRIETIEIKMIRKRGLRAVPMHLIVGERPIEHGRFRADQSQAQTFRIGRLTECFKAIFECPLNGITPRHMTRTRRALCRVLENQTNGGRLKNSKFGCVLATDWRSGPDLA